MKKFFCLILLLVVFVPKQAFASAVSDFNLPSPGLLPTNPLYILKVARDSFLLAITQNPENRTQLLLFLSNKSLATAISLFENNNIRESGVALEKSTDYLIDSIELSKSLPKEKQLNYGLNYLVAIRAHQELSVRIIEKLDSSSQKRNISQLNALIDLKRMLSSQAGLSK